ncbi:hypothetical protein ACH4E7_20385 [Kitasatospora sp. NPDC018058]|uniref:hypothetical protein n=1 Tax=Kitasatospora sp. NPDC018058 TaxID=3364025 RepID=UPI0037BE6BA3
MPDVLHDWIDEGAALDAAYREISARPPESTDRSRVVIGVVDADGRLGPGTLGQVCDPGGSARPRHCRWPRGAS